MTDNEALQAIRAAMDAGWTATEPSEVGLLETISIVVEILDNVEDILVEAGYKSEVVDYDI